jgi:hypothetical protein
MKLEDLSEATRQKIAKVRWDRIIEKHEGPWDWKCLVDDDSDRVVFVNRPDYDPFTRQIEDVPEFLIIDNRPVLLPIPRKYHSNVAIGRTIWSVDGNSVTIFLTDTTFGSDWSEIGFLAICDKVVGEDFWLTIIYHERFVIEPDPLFDVTFDNSHYT